MGKGTGTNRPKTYTQPKPRNHTHKHKQLHPTTKNTLHTQVNKVTAEIATGKRPDPSRTRKLSLPAPMILPNTGGKVGHRRTQIKSVAPQFYWGATAFLRHSGGVSRPSSVLIEYRTFRLRGPTPMGRILARGSTAKGFSGRQQSRWRTSPTSRRKWPARSAEARRSSGGASLVRGQPRPVEPAEIGQGTRTERAGAAPRHRGATTRSRGSTRADHAGPQHIRLRRPASGGRR
jgi:hypothetical protein